MLGFEIGQRKSGFYGEQTDRITEPSSTVLVYSYLDLGTLSNGCFSFFFLIRLELKVECSHFFSGTRSNESFT